MDKHSLIKKITCAIVGCLLAFLELAILDVSPLKALASIILPAGFVSLCMGIFTDWTKDKHVTVLDWVKYAIAFVCIAILGTSVIKSNMYLLIVSGVLAAACVVIQLIESNTLKKEADSNDRS